MTITVAWPPDRRPFDQGRLTARGGGGGGERAAPKRRVISGDPRLTRAAGNAETKPARRGDEHNLKAVSRVIGIPGGSDRTTTPRTRRAIATGESDGAPSEGTGPRGRYHGGRNR